MRITLARHAPRILERRRVVGGTLPLAELARRMGQLALNVAAYVTIGLAWRALAALLASFLSSWVGPKAAAPVYCFVRRCVCSLHLTATLNLACSLLSHASAESLLTFRTHQRKV
jgi:hypothetical protein